MEPASSKWLMTTGVVFMIAIALGAQGVPPEPGEDEGYGNNLAAPVIFAEGHGITGWLTSIDVGLRPTTADLATSGSTDPARPYWDNTEIYVKDGVTYYPQQTPSYWRADWRDGINLDSSVAEEHVIVNWSDNLLNTSWTAKSVIRVETAMYRDAIDPTDTMTGYTMAYLLGEGTTEMWGANKTTYETTRRAVFSALAHLKIQKISGPGGTVIASPSSFDGTVAEGFANDGPGFYGAEINVSGGIVYGYNWMLAQWPGTDAEKAGWWRLTFTLDPSATYTVAADVEEGEEAEAEEPGTTATYTVNRNAIFDGPDASDIAESSLFRPRLVDPYTSVLEILILETKPSGEPTLPLAVSLAGTGSGTVASTPAGISCPTDCSESYARNTVVTLTAIAVSGSTFAGWSGDADCVDGSVTMTGGRYCTATFVGGGGGGGGSATPSEGGPGPGEIPGPPPSAGPSLTAELDGSVITLSWTPPSNTAGLTGYRVEGGTSPGAIEAAIDLGTQTTFTTSIGRGTFYVRVRAMLGGVSGPVSNEVTIANTGAPSRPLGATVRVSGNRVTLSWQAPMSGPVSGYEVHAGTAPGLSDLGAIPLGPGNRSLEANVGDGRYYVHVHAVNSGGMSAQSNDAMLVVGAGTPGVPGRPANLTASVSGNSVALTWFASGGGTATAHLLIVGSAPGLTDLGTFAIGAPTSFSTAGVASGRYYVRVVATNAFGTSEPSNEVVVIVP